MTNKNEVLGIDVVVNTDKAESTMNEFRDDTKWFKKRIESNLSYSLSLDAGKLESKLASARRALRQAIKEWNKDAEIKIRANIGILQQKTTQAKRELRNFARTGEKDVSVLGKLFDNTNKAIDRTQLSLMKVGRSGKELDTLRNRIRQLKKSLDSGSISADKFAKENSKIQKELDKVNSSLSWWIGGKIQWLFAWFAGKMWALALWAGAIWTWKWAINLGDKLEQAQISFEVMLGSAEKAKNMLADLSDFAQKTPFELTGIRQTAKQMLAMWVGADQMIPTMRALGDVSSGLNVPLERLAINYWQVISQWKLTGRELKDFTLAWVPLLDELAKNLWVAKTEIEGMISKGQISSNDVVLAFQTMSSEWGRFANMMERQSSTFSGRWSNLIDQVEALWEKIWAALIPVMKSLVSLLSKLADFIQTSTWKFLLLGTAILTVTKFIVPIVVAIKGLAVAFSAAAASWWVLAWVMAALGWPITLVVWGIAALVGGIVYFNSTTDDTQKKVEGLRTELEDLQEQQQKNREEFEKWTISEEEFQKRTEENTVAQEDLKNKIYETENGMKSYEKRMRELAALKLKPDTEKYVKEKNAIIDLIRAEISLLKVRKQQAYALKAEKDLMRNAQNKHNDMVWRDTWVWTINMVWNLYSEQREIQFQKDFIDKEISKKEDDLLHFDKNIKKMQKEMENAKKVTNTGFSRGGSSRWRWWGSGSSRAKKQANDARKAEEKRLKEAEKLEKKLAKTRTNSYKEAHKRAEKFADIIEETNKQLTEQRKKFEDLKKQALETIQDIDEKLWNEKSSYQEKIAKRYKDIIQWIRDWLTEWSIFYSLSDESLLRAFDEGRISDGNSDWYRKELAIIREMMNEEEIKLARKKEERSETEKITEEYKKQVNLLERNKAVQQAKIDGRFLTNVETGETQFFDKEGKIIEWADRNQQKDFKTQWKELQDIANEELKINKEKMDKIDSLYREFADERNRLNKNYFEEDKNMRINQENMIQTFFLNEIKRMAQQTQAAKQLTQALIALRSAGWSPWSVVTNNYNNSTNTVQNSRNNISVKTVADLKTIDKALGKRVSTRI